jgi:phosphoglycerol transferase
MPFIYLTARQVCSKNVASIVAILAVLGPINSYTAYYMPEAPYFFFFWLITWFVLTLNNSSSVKSWCLAGILLSFAAVVKPHALLILPAFVTYILFISKKSGGRWLLQGLRNAGAFVLFTFVSKFVISYLIAGKAGLTIVGAYASIATRSAAPDIQRYLDLFTLSIHNLTGHILSILLMFGLPVACGIHASLSSLFFKSGGAIVQKISVFTLLMLGNLILMTSIYTASIATLGPAEEIARLHLRYYDFAFPLLFVIAASQLFSDSINDYRKRPVLIALPIAAIITYAAYTRLRPFMPNSVDSPELRGFTYNWTIFYVLSGLSFISLMLWVYAERIGVRFFVFLYLPLAVLISTFYINRELRLHLNPSAYDKAPIFAKQYLSQTDRSKTVIVGPLSGSLYLSSFILDNPDAAREPIPNGAIYDVSKVPPGKEWVLVIGDHPLSGNIICQLPGDGFSLARVRGGDRVDFSRSSWPCIISRVQGLSAAESSGTWSLGDVVTFEFYNPLPGHFRLHLTAHAYNNAIAGKDIVAHVGNSSVRFTLTTSNEERVLEIVNPERSKIVRIDIPRPSVSARTTSDDWGRLGVAFVELRVEPF